MFKTTVILPDGSTLSSGSSGAAIEKMTLTQSVNSRQELTLGSVCAAMVELSVLSPQSLHGMRLFCIGRMGKPCKKWAFSLQKSRCGRAATG